MTGRSADPRRRPAYAKVYNLIDFDDPAIVRYSGDPDEYYALAWAWLMDEHGLFYDHPIAVAAPQLQWFRMNPYPGDDYGWSLGEPAGPGRGNWLGSYLRVVKIGCSQCRYLHGAHHPGCLNKDVLALETCQITVPGLRRSNQMIHLVRRKQTGTPGNTLCDLDRFGPRVSFSMGGGYTYTDFTATACYACSRVAKREFPGVTVTTSMREFAQAFVDDGIPVSNKQWAGLTPAPGTPAVRALARV